MLSWNLAFPQTYFKQIISLSSSPVSSFSSSNWDSLVSLLTSVLTNPFFYAVIWIIVILSILPTVDDD